MNIAIMACRKLSNKCSGTGCFNAYNNSQDAFECYKMKNQYLKVFSIVVGVKK